MSVYRGMDIGTAKPTLAERAGVVHHMIDVADPSEDFSVAAFKDQATQAAAEIAAAGRRAILVGGTGLYFRALLDDLCMPGRWPELAARLYAEAEAVGPEALHRRLESLDPLAASRMNAGNTRRIVRALEVTIASGQPFSSFGPGLNSYAPIPIAQIGIDLDRQVANAAIEQRIDDQMASGWLEEVEALVRREAGISRTARQALGYRELLGHLEGTCFLEEAVLETKRRTRSFARRQRAWFRRDPRIQWVESRSEAARLLSEKLRSSSGLAVGR